MTAACLKLLVRIGSRAPEDPKPGANGYLAAVAGAGRGLAYLRASCLR